MPVSTCPHQAYAATLPRHPAHACNARACAGAPRFPFTSCCNRKHAMPSAVLCGMDATRAGRKHVRQLPAQGKLCAPCCLEVWVEKQIPLSLLTAHRTQHNIIFRGLLLLSCLTLPSCGWTTSRSALGSPCASTGTSRVGQVLQQVPTRMLWLGKAARPSQPRVDLHPCAGRSVVKLGHVGQQDA